MITDAIGDRDKTVSVDAPGKRPADGGYTEVVLNLGTILVDVRQPGSANAPPSRPISAM